MRKALILMACLVASGVASAATLTWSWNASSTNFNASSSAFYMVHATGELTAAEAIYAASSNYGAEGAFGTGWGAWADEKPASLPEGVTTTVEAETNRVTNMGTYVSVRFQDALEAPGLDLSSGYLYLVIFNATDPSNATQVGVGSVNLADVEIGGGSVGPGGSQLTQLSPTWIGGTYSIMPEPTALALLALGVAGIALRRRTY